MARESCGQRTVGGYISMTHKKHLHLGHSRTMICSHLQLSRIHWDTEHQASAIAIAIASSMAAIAERFHWDFVEFRRVLAQSILWWLRLTNCSANGSASRFGQLNYRWNQVHWSFSVHKIHKIIINFHYQYSNWCKPRQRFKFCLAACWLAVRFPLNSQPWSWKFPTFT